MRALSTFIVPSIHTARDRTFQSYLPTLSSSSRRQLSPHHHPMAAHTAARSQFRYYPARAPVVDAIVPWSVASHDYNPTQFTAPHVLENDITRKSGGWADPPNVQDVPAEDWASRVSYEGPLAFDTSGRPMNPRGRTGMAERGYLGKWGPNHAADPIVTRHHPSTGQLQVAAIVRAHRKDVLPGGMVDAGDCFTTVRRDFVEEANILTRRSARWPCSCSTSFANGRLVIKDMSTMHATLTTLDGDLLLTAKVPSLISTSQGDDAAHAFWLDITTADATYAGMSETTRCGWTTQRRCDRARCSRTCASVN